MRLASLPGLTACAWQLRWHLGLRRMLFANAYGVSWELHARKGEKLGSLPLHMGLHCQ